MNKNVYNLIIIIIMVHVNQLLGKASNDSRGTKSVQSRLQVEKNNNNKYTNKHKFLANYMTSKE